MNKIYLILYLFIFGVSVSKYTFGKSNLEDPLYYNSQKKLLILSDISNIKKESLINLITQNDIEIISINITSFKDKEVVGPVFRKKGVKELHVYFFKNVIDFELLKEISNLTNIENLKISCEWVRKNNSNFKEDNLMFLDKLNNLRTIDLRRINIGKNGLHALSKMTKLECISITDSYLLKNNKCIQKFIVNCPFVTFDCLDKLLTISSLKIINIVSSDNTKYNLDKFKIAKCKLREINFHEKLSLADFKKLNSFDIYEKDCIIVMGNGYLYNDKEIEEIRANVNKFTVDFIVETGDDGTN